MSKVHNKIFSYPFFRFNTIVTICEYNVKNNLG